MANVNALASFIALIQGDRLATIGAAVTAFEADYSHFAKANNRDPLNAAVTALKKSPKDKAIGEAITAAYKAGGLTVGYIGAQSGKFASQPADVQAVYVEAITGASEAFKASLDACEAFADKAVKSEADKAKAKADKAAKASEASEALITAKIQAGELVRAIDVKQLSDFGALALAEALAPMLATDSNLFSAEAMTIVNNIAGMPAAALRMAAMNAEIDALNAELAAVREEAKAAVKEAYSNAAKPAKAKAKV